MNRQPKSIFYILDLDRTLLDTIKNAIFFIQIVQNYDPVVGQKLNETNEAYIVSGETFSMAAFISGLLNPEQVKAIEDEYLRRAVSEDFLNPGARELMAALKSHNKSFGIVTYGTFDGQELKLRGNNLFGTPHIITEEKHKGILFTSWQADDGKFHIPKELSPDELIVDELVLVDDKTQSFDALPDGARGYWVSLPSNPYKEGTIPETVKFVTSLHDVIVGESLA